jgi:hypothetical protein
MKMNRNLIKTGCLLLAAQFAVSCEGILDTTSRNILTDDVVWGNEDGIVAYLSNMYNSVLYEDLSYTTYEEGTFMPQVTDEAVRAYTWGVVNTSIPDALFDWWGYGNIRTVNAFLQRMETSTIDAEKKAWYIAEGRFIRAFHYFNLVKRYGGVPLITEPQEFTGDNIAELQVPRNTEKEIYEFIRTELDAIAGTNGLPESWDTANQYRANRYSALALKSRAMLYAASIATYGEVQINGLVGIPASDKDFYWTEAMKAAAEIINSTKFSLYRENADKAANFQEMFLVKGMSSESIFTKAYVYPGKAHNFEFYNAPQTFKDMAWGYGCITNPTLQFVEEFEYTDGSPGALKLDDPVTGEPIKYSNPYDLFNGKDPRLHASVMLPFTPWKGGVVEIRKGILETNGNLLTAANTSAASYGTGENSISVVGKDGPWVAQDPTKTGFYVKKFMNPTEPVLYSRGTTYGMVFRYAEILLNYAEAAVELGQNTDKALEYINDIRDRAGIKTHDAIDLAKVRKERKLELAFENHRWWDIIRWRAGAEYIDGLDGRALLPYLVWEDGKHPSEMKYIFKAAYVKDFVANRPARVFLPKMYYRNIPSDQRATNPNLVPNPLY